MRSKTAFFISLVMLATFLFVTAIAFAQQKAMNPGKAAEQCMKGGDVFPAAKTRAACLTAGGSWVKGTAPKMPDDPFGKSKVETADPFGKSKQMPDDPFGKGKQMPIDPLEKPVQ
ncbi:MAG: hypothetical protein EHM37_21090 [Deltaproteobacteria bacterium]|nr:MAG: hypothetical protein EHM37_21090 [Deltaproteobacteria bacterium]